MPHIEDALEWTPRHCFGAGWSRDQNTKTASLKAYCQHPSVSATDLHMIEKPAAYWLTAGWTRDPIRHGLRPKSRWSADEVQILLHRYWEAAATICPPRQPRADKLLLTIHCICSGRKGLIEGRDTRHSRNWLQHLDFFFFFFFFLPIPSPFSFSPTSASMWSHGTAGVAANPHTVSPISSSWTGK